MFAPAYADRGNIIPVNDNVYVFINGVRVADRGYSYSAINAGNNGTAPFANETDGWYASGSLGYAAVQALRPGENVIDLVVEEICGSGGIGRLDLKLVFGTPPTLFYGLTTTNSSFGNPVVDSQGNVLAVRTVFGAGCGFGFCGMHLNSINPNGTLNWEVQHLTGGNSIANKSLFLGPNDRAHVLGQYHISAFEPNGQSSAGFPIEMPPGGNWTFTGIGLDPSTGTVFSSLGVFGSCFNSCHKTVNATARDGSLLWQNLYPRDGTNLGVVRGPGGRLFTIAVNGRPAPTLIGLDPTTGTEVCSRPWGPPWMVGGDAALFTSAGNEVRVFDGNCQAGPAFNSTYANVRVFAYVDGIAIGTESPSGSDTRPPRLFGVAADATTWINPVIRPAVGSNPVRTARGSSAFVVGADLEDASVEKIFELDVRSGAILRKIGIQGLCTQCGVAISPDGSALYINDLNSTRIYRVQ